MTPPVADHEAFMRQALDEARRARHVGEVPIGAVVVAQGRVAAEGFNQPIRSADPTAHAEIVALREAAQHVGRWRLDGWTCIVTLEPCPMCAGALVNARVARLVFGCRDPKAGAARTLYEPQPPARGDRRRAGGGMPPGGRRLLQVPPRRGPEVESPVAAGFGGCYR